MESAATMPTIVPPIVAPQCQPPLPKTGFTPPVLNNRVNLEFFGQLTPRWNVIRHQIMIEQQNTLSGHTYDTLANLDRSPLLINRQNFIRMWKTLVLKRVQDLHERHTGMRPQNYVRINRGIQIPGPLADLLHSLGSYKSTATGHRHVIDAPARPAVNPPNWWNLDEQISTSWNATMDRASLYYVMKEFPSQNEWEDRPLMLTRLQAANNNAQVVGWTNEPRMTDAFIRLVNNELFAEHEYITAINCSLEMTIEYQTRTIIAEYLDGYIIA